MLPSFNDMSVRSSGSGVKMAGIRMPELDRARTGLQAAPGRIQRDPPIARADLTLIHRKRSVALVAEHLRGHRLEHAGPRPKRHRHRQPPEADRTAPPLV